MALANGGASVIECNSTEHSGNSARISAALIPATFRLRGLLTLKSFQRITPPGLTMRIISTAISFLTGILRIDVKSVNWLTRSNEPLF